MMISIFFPLYGAILCRWMGHGSQYKRFFPHPWPGLLMALPYALICIPPMGPSWWAVVPVLALTFAGTQVGRGGYFLDLFNARKHHPDPILRLFYGPDPRLSGQSVEQYGWTKLYWRCVTGLALCGMMITVPAGIVLAFTNPIHGALIGLSGALMGLAYMIGEFMFDNMKQELRKTYDGTQYMAIKALPRHLDQSTAIGEFLTGLFLYGALCLTL